MASPIFLSRTADKLRSDLAEWARETAKQGQDYLVNEKGDRIYHKQKNSHLVNPLLKDMGIAVGYAVSRMMDCADRPSGFRLYNVAIFNYPTHRTEPQRRAVYRPH
jgi:hypothetical protein